MIETLDLLNELRSGGITVSVDGSDITWKAPPGAMTADLLIYIKRQKPTLLHILSGTDPRPDLTQDTAHWTRLLQIASDDAHTVTGLYGLLLGIRSWGASLEIENGRTRIARGEIDESDYEAIRSTELLPRRSHISALLSTMAGRTELDA